ncbi:MAG: hypothetical protein QOJ16_4078 [Acidobacteriota bacterium]|jgi:hypothetical protein|nr:hypothetical protein [Acidobacteriota bacterium]
MSRRNLRKCMAALALVGALALPLARPAAAAGARRAPRPKPAPVASLWGQAWGWWTILVGEAGGCVDPNGRCEQALQRSPGGEPHPVTLGDAGGCVDPNGKCGH